MPVESNHRSIAIVSVEALVNELLEGYHKWIVRHPEINPQTQTASSRPAGGAQSGATEASQSRGQLLIRTPSIDLYSPSGISLYHGTNCEENAAWIRALPRGIQTGGAAKTDGLRPTLQEAVEMFSELGPYKAVPMAKNEYTLFALANPSLTACKAQDEAIQQLKGSAPGTSIRVIEVRLHSK
jgi:hypothetical protein